MLTLHRREFRIERHLLMAQQCEGNALRTILVTVTICVALFVSALLNARNAAAFGGLGNEVPLVDSVSVSPQPVSVNSPASISCSAHDTDGIIESVAVTVTPLLPPGPALTLSTQFTPGASITAVSAWTPTAAGDYQIKCEVWDNGGPFGGTAWAQGITNLQVVATAGSAPVIDSFTATPSVLLGGEISSLSVLAHDPDSDPLSYSWSAIAGSIAGNGNTAAWTAPSSYGSYQVSVEVADGNGHTTTASLDVQVVVARSAGAIGESPGFYPSRVAVDASGFIYVSNTGDNSVEQFTPGGVKLRTVKAPGLLSSVAADGRGNFLAGDAERGRVVIVDPLGHEITSLGEGLGEFGLPSDIAVDSGDGRIFVADGKASAVKIYEASGDFSSSFPTTWAYPNGIALNPGGGIFISDVKSGKVTAFDSMGNAGATFGSFGNGAGELTRPAGVAVDNSGSLFAVDTFQSRLALFENGVFSAFLGSNGSGPGELDLPMDAAIDIWGRLIVTNPENHRLEVYELGGSTAPACDQDSDCDGISDQVESALGRDPLNDADAAADSDGDGLKDIDELYYGTNASMPDSDGDGVSDFDELLEGAQPLDPSDHGLWADAGADFMADPGRIKLDGSRSRSHGATANYYSWTQNGGPAAVELENSNGPSPYFVGTVPGDYFFGLRVGDGQDWGPACALTVTVADVPPSADAGPDLSIRRGGRIALDARFSADANRQSLDFHWSQVSGPPVDIPLPSALYQELRLREAGVYEFELTVSDGVASDSDRVAVSVHHPRNHIPLAVAGDIVAALGNTVTLDATRSLDSDGDALSYSWQQVSGPPVSLLGSDTATPSFDPAQSGVYLFELRVNDGSYDSVPADVRVAVHDGPPTLPDADAGPDISVEILTEVPLECPVQANCVWVQTSGVHVPLESNGTVTSFVPVQAGNYEFELQLFDTGGPGGSDRVLVSVSDSTANLTPTGNAYAGSKSIRAGRRARLSVDGIVDDGPRRSLNFLWTQRSGPPAIINRPHRRSSKVSAPVAGDYVFELRIDDGITRSAPLAVNFTANQTPRRAANTQGVEQ